MDLDITKRQNLQESIDLLIAQRYYYNRAKKFRNPRLYISIIIAASSPLIVYKWPEYISILGVIGGLWIILAYIIKAYFENSNINKAATIQEEFDVSLYKIPWNEILVRKKIIPEEINSAKRKFKENVSLLKDWYGNLSGVSYPFDVILCQRSNLVWDWRLKRGYSFFIFAAILIYFIFTLIVAASNNLKLTEYILSLFLPALSVYIFGIDEGSEHYKAAIKRKDLEEEIQRILDNASTDPPSINIEELRKIQDCIYNFRKGPLVPNWFYKVSREKYEKDMKAALTKLKKQILKT